MARNRESAKKAGAKFEQDTCDYLRCVLGDDRIERRVKRGHLDAGDVAGLRIPEGEVVMECKDERIPRPWGYLEEAERERANAHAALGVVCLKVPDFGRGRMGSQAVLMDRLAFNVFFENEFNGPLSLGLFRADSLCAYVVQSARDGLPRQFSHRTDAGRKMVLMTLQAFAAEVAGGPVMLETERWAAEWKRRPRGREVA